MERKVAEYIELKDCRLSEMRISEYWTAGQQYIGGEDCIMLERREAGRLKNIAHEDDRIFTRRTTEFVQEV